MLSKKKKCSVCLRMLPAKDFSSGTNKKGDFERKKKYVFVKLREQIRQKGTGVSAI